MKRLLHFLLFTATVLMPARAELNIVATLPDLGSIAETIGGKAVKVTSLARGGEDPHYVEPRPSFIRILNQADLLIETGADLEIGWLPRLVDSARNRKIMLGQPGRLLGTDGVRLIDIPTGPVDRSMGDVHPTGNPHFLLDPENGKQFARSLAARLAQLDPKNAALFEANRDALVKRLDAKLAEWSTAMAPFRGTPVVTYHRSFNYLLDRFGLVLAGTIEPKPGIEPSATHIRDLIPQMKERGVKLVIIEPSRPTRTPTQVARETGAKLIQLPIAPQGHAKATDYVALLDFNVTSIADALRSVK